VIKLNYSRKDKLDKTITLPGSKYLANRLLILAALSESRTRLNNMPHNEDIDTSIEGLSALGARFVWQGDQLDCYGFKSAANGYQVEENLNINSSHSGSFSRFVTPLLALFDNKIALSSLLAPFSCSFIAAIRTLLSLCCQLFLFLNRLKIIRITLRWLFINW